MKRYEVSIADRPTPQLIEVIGEQILEGEIEVRPPPAVYVAYTDIVPDEYQNKLSALDQALTLCKWQIGDIALEVVENVHLRRHVSGTVVTDEMVYEAVGYFCHLTGRTVRYYAMLSRDYPFEVRQKYDSVPLHAFSEARLFRDKKEEFLEFAAQNVETPVGELRWSFASQLEGESDQKVQERGKVVKRGSQVIALGEISTVIHVLQKIVRRVPLRDAIRERLENVLEEIKDLLPELQQEADRLRDL